MNKKLVVFEIITGVVLLAVLCIVIFLKFGGKKEKNTSDDYAQNDSYEAGEMPDRVDTKKFYEKAGTIRNITKFSESKTQLTEREACELFKKRGFEEIIITSSYDENGEIIDEAEIDELSDSIHPEYTASYVTDNNEWWSISVINGKIMAMPVNFKISEYSSQEIYISEDENITGIDAGEQKFYEVTPEKNVAKVIVVEKIDKSTLDQLTEEDFKR